jgi:hypothetical protein
MEEADGTALTLAEVTPDGRLRWQGPCPDKPGERRTVETGLSFAVEHMGRAEDAHRRFDPPPSVGTSFRDGIGWTWTVAWASPPSPLDTRFFDVVWLAQDPATGVVYTAASGRCAWGSKLQRYKAPVANVARFALSAGRELAP